MAFATASRKPGDSAQTAAPPQAQARPRQSPGKAWHPSAPDPPARARARQRMPEPQRARPPARAGTKTWWARCPPCSGKPSPQRTPGRKPGSGASTEPSIGLRIVNLAKHQVPRALAAPSSELPLRRIVSFVRLWSKLTILRSLMAKTLDYLRYRKAHTRTTGKNVHFSLPRPRKTVCFDRQRPKQTVFRIARPARQPNPMLSKQRSRHRSRRAFRKCSRKLAAVSHDACASPPYHNYLAQTLSIPYANLADLFPNPYQSLPHSLHRKILVLPGEILWYLRLYDHCDLTYFSNRVLACARIAQAQGHVCPHSNRTPVRGPHHRRPPPR